MADRKGNSGIFREKSLKRVSSPDELDRYIKTATPTLWLLLVSIILLLAGVIVWACVGTIASEATVGCSAKAGELTACIPEADHAKLRDTSYIEIDGTAYPVASSEGPILAEESGDSFLLQAAEIEDGSWYYILHCDASGLPDGKYKAKVVYETVSPITFIVN